MPAAVDKHTFERAIGAVHFPSKISFFLVQKNIDFCRAFVPSNLVCVTETSLPFNQGLPRNPQLHGDGLGAAFAL